MASARRCSIQIYGKSLCLDLTTLLSQSQTISVHCHASSTRWFRSCTCSKRPKPSNKRSSSSKCNASTTAQCNHCCPSTHNDQAASGTSSSHSGPRSVWPNGFNSSVSIPIVNHSYRLCILTVGPYSGVAVGSSIGHAIGGFFGGGSSSTVEAQQQDGTLASQATEGNFQNNNISRSCEPDAKAFTKCLDENKGEYQMSVCGWYLEQLVCLVQFGFSLKHF